MPEIVEDGVTGFILPPNDPDALREKIGWMRDHPRTPRRWAVRARDACSTQFIWPRVVDRCLAIL